MIGLIGFSFFVAGSKTKKGPSGCNEKGINGYRSRSTNNNKGSMHVIRTRYRKARRIIGIFYKRERERLLPHE